MISHMALIRKAAQGRDIERNGSFAANKSALALRKLGNSVAGEIEDFLSHEFRSSVPADEIEGHPWLGLIDVLHVYFELIAKSHKANSFEFLLSLHGWLREAAMGSVFRIWGPSQNRLRDRKVPKGLRNAVERLSVSGSEKERDFAKRLLRHLRGNAPVTRRAAVSKG